MNELITKILEKHRIQTNPKLLGVSDLEKAIIEICEEQKKECANEAKMRFWDGHFQEAKLMQHFQIGANNLTPSKESILNSKNIAE